MGCGAQKAAPTITPFWHLPGVIWKLSAMSRLCRSLLGSWGCAGSGTAWPAWDFLFVLPGRKSGVNLRAKQHWHLGTKHK